MTLDNHNVVLSATVVKAAEDAPEHNDPRSTLILRSFRNVLEAVASEQRAFDELARDTDFRQRVPPRQLSPVLQLDWQGVDTPLASPAVQLDYAGHHYQITDPAVGPAVNADSRWNRDVFRLLVNLSSQVTVDITKFQRQVLEVN
ncbi:MAG: hypothetical protein J0L65_02630 [Xanthomonadales bacterium]|nr:hypothetical protein [Xanthomonadales bacterium]HRD73256.1 hypothetical protein [Aquimonas sp.]